jgi:hypothetical protein
MPKRSRSGVMPVRVEGRTFGSKTEAEYGAELQWREQAKEIVDLRYQRTVLLAGSVKYKADFDYLEAGRRVYVDTKGGHAFNERFAVITQLWPLWGPGPLQVVIAVKGRRTAFMVAREILPQPQALAAFCAATLAQLHGEDPSPVPLDRLR